MARTNTEKQADRRKREKAWLKANGFTSWEAVHTALMNGTFSVGSHSQTQTKKGKDKMNQSQSPTPTKKKTAADMDFFDALRVTLAGNNKVARREWTEPAFIYMRDGILRIERGGTEYNLIVSEGDMRGTDWYTVP